MGTFDLIGDICNFAASISEDDSNQAVVAVSFNGSQRSLTVVIYADGDIDSPSEQFFVLLGAIDYRPKARLEEIKAALQGLGKYFEEVADNG